MKKHAYLIIAHNEFHMLKKLITELDDERNDIYLHIDKKTKYVDVDEISSWAAHSNIHIIKRTNIYWGTLSIVKCELALLEEAVKVQHSYYHLISGVDFPLKNQDKIHEFFDRENSEFISFHEDGEYGDHFMDKVRYYYPLLRFVGKGHFDGPGKRLKFMRWLGELQWRILKFQENKGIDRTKNYKDIHFVKGDQWFSITHEFARYILMNKKDILIMYRLTSTPDEIAIPTLAINSPFSENIQNTCLRQIDWLRGGPYEYTVTDLPELEKSEAFFARKISYDHEPLLVNSLIYDIHDLKHQKEEPLISIIVPCFNVDKYIEKCVDSLIAQTYPNTEIILVDDGSSDNTAVIVDNYAKKHSNIIALHRENGGLSAARNTGLANAKGEYVAFVDSDDWVEADYIDRLYAAIEREYTDIAVCGYTKEDEDKGAVTFDDSKVISPYEAMKVLGDIYPKENVLLTITWNKLYKRHLFDDIKFREGVIHEDEFMTHRILGSADSISLITDCLYHYRIRRGSITGDDRKQGIRHLDIIDAYDDRIKYSESMQYGDLLILMLYTYFEGIKQLMINYSDEVIKKNNLMTIFRKHVLRMYTKYFTKLDSYQKKEYMRFILAPSKYRRRVLEIMKLNMRNK